MDQWLTGSKDGFRARVADLLWAQWTTMGVAGQQAIAGDQVLDPEALVAVTCTIGREDPRLFDAMLDWLGVNGRYLNPHRLRRMLTTWPLAGAPVWMAVAATLQQGGPTDKWARSARSKVPGGARPEPLFRLADGRPLPVLHRPDPVFASCGWLREPYRPRGVARPFPPAGPATLLLRLRALLGIHARCEILAFLATAGRGTPRAVARACGYFPATVIKALSDMGESGFVRSRVEGRLRPYVLVDEGWRALLVGNRPASWVIWPAVFSVLEQLWIHLHQPDLAGRSPLELASGLRRLLKDQVGKTSTQTGLAVTLDDWSDHPGEALLPYLSSRLLTLLDILLPRGS